MWRVYLKGEPVDCTLVGILDEETARKLLFANQSKGSGVSSVAKGPKGPIQAFTEVLILQKQHPTMIHRASLEEFGTGCGSMVFVMTTGDQRNTGVNIVRRMHMDQGSDLKGAWLVFDVVERKVKGAWKCLGVHVYSHHQRRLLTIAIAYIKQETAEVLYQFWELFKFVCGKSNVEVRKDILVMVGLFFYEFCYNTGMRRHFLI